jgi:hypothetical protein
MVSSGALHNAKPCQVHEKRSSALHARRLSPDVATPASLEGPRTLSSQRHEFHPRTAMGHPREDVTFGFDLLTSMTSHYVRRTP